MGACSVGAFVGGAVVGTEVVGDVVVGLHDGDGEPDQLGDIE